MPESGSKPPGSPARRPRVTVALAMSADGRITPDGRAPVTFPSREDRRHLFRLRDAADAILATGATLRAEDPPLLPDEPRRQARAATGLSPNPWRVILSSRLELPFDGRALRPRSQAPVVFLCGSEAPADRRRRAEAIGTVIVSEAAEVELEAALSTLAAELGVRHLLAEGGGRLTGRLLALGLVDELWLTICPLLFGGDGPTPCDGVGFSLAGAPRLRLLSCRPHGGEIFAHYAVETPGETAGNPVAAPDVEAAEGSGASSSKTTSEGR